MSRFDHARRSAIAVWTGATVIWATTLVALHVSEGEAPPPVPANPGSGLVVLRPSGASGTAPSTEPVPEAPVPVAPATSAAPQPVSSGS